MRAAEEQFGDDLVILNVDQEEPVDAVERFADQYGLISPFLMDPQGEIGRLYELRGTPTTYFINPQGVVQAIQPGFISTAWIDDNLRQSS